MTHYGNSVILDFLYRKFIHISIKVVCPLTKLRDYYELMAFKYLYKCTSYRILPVHILTILNKFILRILQH